MIQTERYTELIRTEAHRLGFEFVGFARAERLEAEARQLEKWLNQGFHGKMSYMENYFDLRTDPTLLVPGAKSIICLAFNYFTTETPTDPEAPRISRYAYGEDYHRVVKNRLRDLLLYMKETIGEIQGRCFVDSAPVMEREWARRAGLGWNGKNTLTMHPKRGSYFFLAEIICDLPLRWDNPMRDYCGTCRRCIDACPTEAIAPQGYLLDASKCISYLTIELRDQIPENYRDNMQNLLFGCDICQEVCPWNRFAQPHRTEALLPHPDLLHLRKADWEEMTEATFRRIFKKSAVKRIKFEGLKRNIQFLQPKS